jgi:hypothetical protein
MELRLQAAQLKQRTSSSTALEFSSNSLLVQRAELK